MSIQILPVGGEKQGLQGPACDPKAGPKKQTRKVAGAALTILACALSPCCTPLFVPVLVALAAGTPFALWFGQNLGWVYGALTLVSVASAVIAVRMFRKARRK